ncbi:MAG: DNA repair protein RecO [Gammaproteobacteria bacterium]
MSGSRITLQPAFILHQRPFRDSSTLLEVFSRDFGRIGLVARGARGGKSRLRGTLQPFRPLLVSWLARGELGTLSGAEADGPSLSLSGTAVFSGFYVNELLLRLLPRQDPHPELFGPYAEAIRALGAQAGERPLRVFEKRLLDALGYGLLLDCDARTGASLDPQLAYEYQLEIGPIPVEDDRAAGLRMVGSSLLSLYREELADAQSMSDAKRLLRAALALYLGDRPLKTREVLKRMLDKPASG